MCSENDAGRAGEREQDGVVVTGRDEERPTRRPKHAAPPPTGDYESTPAENYRPSPSGNFWPLDPSDRPDNPLPKPPLDRASADYSALDPRAAEPATVAFDQPIRPAEPVPASVYNPSHSSRAPVRETATSSRRPAPGQSALRLVWIYPDLLSTYGDRGNLLMLSRRAALRGIEVEPIGVNSDQAVPREGDIYLLGGGEDLPQVLAARRLLADGGLTAAAARGAVVFAVCAGYQLIGEVFGGAQGEPVQGLGLIDLRSGRGDRRGVGEITADVDPALGVDRLTGFENHQGMTNRGPGAKPLASVRVGVGNGDGTEGAYAGRILGTYLHGPALVRNPALADLLLTWATGRLAPLPESAEVWTTRLRAERLAAVPA
jgi:lipid II isoglutaminyl synthase (glutamine-hydrolysing)